MSEPPSIEQLILDKIDALDRNLNKRLDIEMKAVGDRFTAQDRALEAIGEHTSKTNGHVADLYEKSATKKELAVVEATVAEHEAARQRELGLTSALKFVPWVLSALLSAGTVILISVATGVHP